MKSEDKPTVPASGSSKIASGGSDTRPVPERLTRPSVPALDAISGQAISVLDDGFVRLLDYMGDDAAVVYRPLEFRTESGTRPLHEDRGLIRYLMRHSHTTPFEMCEIKLHIRVYQWTHGVSGSVTAQQT